MASAVMLHVDMPSEMVATVVRLTLAALAPAAGASVTTKVEKDLAAVIKTGLEKEVGGCWHVALGSSYGASVSHDHSSLLMFSIGKTHVLAFTTPDDTLLVTKGASSTSAGPTVKTRKADSKKEDEDEEA
jgi:hypothetical protein